MDESDESHGLVPPLKVLRKRLDGVYRAEGLAGPTRRYVLIVALLVGLASLPTLAAITAGSNELDDGTTGAMDVPFLPPASGGPIVPPPVSAVPVPIVPDRPTSAGVRQSRSPHSSSRTPGASDNRTGSSRGGGSTTGSLQAGAPAAGSDKTAGRPAPEAGRTTPHQATEPPAKPRPHQPANPRPHEPPANPRPHEPPTNPRPHEPANPRPHEPPARPNPHQPPANPHPHEPPAKPRPHQPEGLPPPGSRPFCHERGDGGARESRHHRPDWSPHRHSEDSTHRAHWSHHREGRTRHVLVHIRPAGRHSPRTVIHSHSPSHSRRSEMSERPHNVRPGPVLERTHNSRRHHHAVPAPSRGHQGGYQGSHRAEHWHWPTDNSGTDHRATEHRSVDHRTSDHRTGDHRISEHRAGDHWTSNHRAGDNRTGDSWTGDRRAGDHWTGDHRDGDPRTTACRHAAADRSSRMGKHHAERW